MILNTTKWVAADLGQSQEFDMIAAAAPEGLAQAIRRSLPFPVGEMTFQQKGTGLLENVTGDLITHVAYARETSYHALWYQISFTNKGDTPISGLKVKPFTLRLAVEPPQAIPRIRYLTGSQITMQPTQAGLSRWWSGRS